MTHPAIPTLFKVERARRRMSMRQFAAALGVDNFQSIDQWEGGKQPTSDMLIRIWLTAPESWARALGFRCLNLRYPNAFISPVPKVPA